MADENPPQKENGNRAWVWATILVLPLLVAGTFWFAAYVAGIRYHRDVTRMAFNDNLELLDDVKKAVGASLDTLQQVRALAPDSAGDRPYIVVSIAEHRLWFKLSIVSGLKRSALLVLILNIFSSACSITESIGVAVS